MVMKVSTGQYFDNASSQLATLQNSLSQTQTQLSTSLQIVKPSDAPDKASLVTRLNTEIAKQNTYVASIKTLQNSLTAQDTALKSADDVMARIKELTVQANSDTMGASDRNTIANEMTQLRDQLLSIANTQDSNGNYIFAARIWSRRQRHDQLSGRSVALDCGGGGQSSCFNEYARFRCFYPTCER